VLPASAQTPLARLCFPWETFPAAREPRNDLSGEDSPCFGGGPRRRGRRNSRPGVTGNDRKDFPERSGQPALCGARLPAPPSGLAGSVAVLGAGLRRCSARPRIPSRHPRERKFGAEEKVIRSPPQPPGDLDPALLRDVPYGILRTEFTVPLEATAYLHLLFGMGFVPNRLFRTLPHARRNLSATESRSRLSSL